MSLLSLALGATEHFQNEQISIMRVTTKMLKQTDTTKADTEGFVNQLQKITGNRVAVIFFELPDGSYKLSFRSNGKDDVRSAAVELGGGGHMNAAGGKIDGPYETAIPRVLELINKYVDLSEKV